MEIVSGVLDALEYSHRVGIVHRDIKPGNIMLTSTGAVIEAVKNNASAIGYASLSSVEDQDGIKALKVGGVVCSEETVLDGSYTIQRPFVLVTKSDTKLSETAQKFFDYAISADANDLIREAGAVPVAK